MFDKFDLLPDFVPAENNSSKTVNFYPSTFKFSAVFSLAIIKLLPETESGTLMQDLRPERLMNKIFPRWCANAKKHLCDIIKGRQYVYLTGRQMRTALPKLKESCTPEIFATKMIVY